MFGDDMPRHLADGTEIRNGMLLHNTFDDEPVTTVTAAWCGRGHNANRPPDADGITRATRSVHKDGTTRYVNVWEGYWHVAVRNGPTGVCRFVHATELRRES